MRVLRAVLLGLFALSTAAGAQQSGAAAITGAANQDSESVADEYRRNRLAFQRQKADLLVALPTLEAEKSRKEEQLRALRAEGTRLENLARDTPEDLASLRAATRGVESATFFALQPFVALTTRAFASPDAGSDAGSLPWVSRGTVSRYLSFLLPLTILLLLLGLRHFQPALYGQHRKHLHMLVLSVVLVLPLSSFAQDGGQAPQPASVTPEPELADMLRTADEVLSLTRVQRYIQWFSSARSAGRRLRVSDVDLSATPFVYFESVVGGSGEFHMTFAALHFANGDIEAARRQMLPLADPGTRYASRNANPDQYEAMFATASVFLMQNGAPELADEIIRQHMAELRNPETFESVYPALLESSFGRTAVALASQLIEQTSDADALLGYAGTLYDSGFATYGQSALAKALDNVDTASALRDGFELALAQREDALLQQALRKAGAMIDDLAIVFALADALRDLERGPAARALLESVIDRARAEAGFTIGEAPTSATEALAYVSAQAFDRDMLTIAELAAAAAIGPLSRVERDALTVSTPTAALDPLRIPEPEKLVSTLYLGLLDEERGRTADARQRYTEETRELLGNLLESNGLYVPDMMNHLALLGSTLSAQTEPETLAQLDRVLQRLESEALDDLRTEQSTALESARAEVAALDAEIAATLAGIGTVQAELEARERSVLGLALSAILLLLRSVSLLLVCAAITFVVVQFALRYSKTRSMHRGHAFGWKLFEGLGWTWVGSIFSAPLGLLAIVVSQFFLLFQERSELAFEYRKKTPHPSPAPAPLETRQKPRKPAADRSDQEWSKVIQMLREV